MKDLTGTYWQISKTSAIDGLFKVIYYNGDNNYNITVYYYNGHSSKDIDLHYSTIERHKQITEDEFNLLRIK
jgi:hypothetical protein